MANIGPTIPPKMPPIKIDIKTNTEGNPDNFLVNTGIKILLSICWIITKKITAIINLGTESNRAKAAKITPETIGPTIGTIFNNPAKSAKAKANLIFKKTHKRNVIMATQRQAKTLLPNQATT